jgi:hypothetical protein
MSLGEESETCWPLASPPEMVETPDLQAKDRLAIRLQLLEPPVDDVTIPYPSSRLPADRWGSEDEA